MGTPSAWVLQQVVVEVQFARGMVYLDRCGSLMLQLEDALGKGFVGSVPTMNQAEIRSRSEHMVLTYGIKNFTVAQEWVKTAARVEHIAPMAWEKIAGSLDVGKHVTRCGVRYIMWSRAEDDPKARELVASCALAPSSDLWKSISTGTMLAYSAVSEDKAGKLRVTIESTETTIDGALPATLEQLIPRHAFVLDMDHTYPGKGSYSLSKADLKDFIRSSWQRTRDAAKVVGPPLGFANE